MAQTFNRQKFSELVLYVAERSVSDPKFGATKLNKILFFSDFIAYATYGRSITGAEYQRLSHGPAPRQLKPIQNELVEEGHARIETRNYFGHVQHRIVPNRPLNLSLFTTDEIALVDEMLSQLREHNAVSISEMSHEVSMAWQVAQDGETIPYSTVFVSTNPPTPSDIARGQELAAKYGWQ